LQTNLVHLANLIIDIGNTRIKSALFDKKELQDEFAHLNLEGALEFWRKLRFEQCLVSSVKWTESELKGFLPFEFQILNHDTKLPIGNKYGSPKTLGLDRIAAAVGAWSMVNQKPVLSIDLGSCITFDLVDQSGVFLGGAISPGLAMRARAMKDFTARLPLVELKNRPSELIGDSTVSCMQIGIWSGVDHEIIGQIKAYQEKYPQIEVFVCGGDAQSFDSLVKDHIFVVPNLVLHGLNTILNHNVE
jgi:type III pantothenate kinase